MGFINLAEKTIHAKLVYYGVGMGGKTTSLQAVHGVLCPSHEVKLVSINTDEDATLLFDFLPINLGLVEGFQIMIQGFTVPGQPKYKLMRKYVLQGADAVVLVVDSQTSRLEENIQALEGLQDNLRLNGLQPETIPLVMQYNKRDLDDILKEEELDRHFLCRDDVQAFPSVAIENQGVFETFVHAAGLLVEAKIKLYGLGRGEVDPKVVAEAARRRLWEIYDQVRGNAEVAGDVLSVDVPEVEPERSGARGDAGVGTTRKKGKKTGKAARKKASTRKGTRKDRKKGGRRPDRKKGRDLDLGKDLGKELGKELDEELDLEEGRLRLSDEDLDLTPFDKREKHVDLPDGSDDLDFDDLDDEGHGEGRDKAGAGAGAEVGDEIFSDEDLDVDLNIEAVVEPDYEGKQTRPEEDNTLLDKAVQSNLQLVEAFGELDQYKLALERKNQELVKVAQNTVHDLNRPLSAIKLMLSSAVQGYLGEVNHTLASGLDNALIAAKQMERLLEDMMDSSRLDFDGVHLHFEEVDTTLLVAEVIRTLKAEIQDKDVGIRLEPLPLAVADEWALFKTFMNLIGNAIQYAHPERPPRIRVYHRDMPDYHVFVVQDNGIGIPESSMDRLFKRFERGENTAGISGTGLGLHIVKEVVQGHGGHVQVESTEGEGSRFSVYLPKQPTQAPHSPVAEIERSGAKPVGNRSD